MEHGVGVNGHPRDGLAGEKIPLCARIIHVADALDSILTTRMYRSGRPARAALAELRREFNGGEPERQGNEKNYAKYQARVAEMRDNIFRGEKNVEALKREIGNIR